MYESTSIATGLCRIDRKAAKLSTIADELALIGVDYVSSQVLAGKLRAAGWTYKATGRMRLWIAPGFDAETAGVSQPANIRFRVAQSVGRIIADLDEITVAALHAQIKSLHGGKVDVGIANKSMELRVKRGEFVMVRDRENPRWKREAIDGAV